MQKIPARVIAIVVSKLLWAATILAALRGLATAATAGSLELLLGALAIPAIAFILAQAWDHLLSEVMAVTPEVAARTPRPAGGKTVPGTRLTTQSEFEEEFGPRR